MDCLKNKCRVCKKLFCCSTHRADHEVKNHSEMYPMLKQDLVKLFQKRAENILLKSRNQQASNQASDIKEVHGNNVKEKLSNQFIPRNAKKRMHNEINRRVFSTSVTVSETRKILVPVHRLSENHQSNNQVQLKRNYQPQTLKQNYQPQIFEWPEKPSPYDCKEVKTSTPIIEELSKEKTPTGKWDYISPESTISFYSTPLMSADGKSEGRPVFRPQLNKTLITPLRSIMNKNTKFGSDSDQGPNSNFNSSKGRRVTFSFSSSRVSSTTSSPLESVQEIEIHEEIQDENSKIRTSVSSVKSLSERELSTGALGEQNYVLQLTSTINSCVRSNELHDGNITNTQRFDDDSLASVKGGLFSCMTSMFCSAVHTFPLWRGSNNRLKRSRSPERGVEKVVVHSPLPKRKCYPSDLRLNPIRARKPISQA